MDSKSELEDGFLAPADQGFFFFCVELLSSTNRVAAYYECFPIEFVAI